jgi:hypothetical protein
MDKIPNKFTQPFVGNRIPPHLNKYHINDKKNDDEMIKKIFMSIEEGNIGKIHEEFNNNTSSFFVKNIDDESILHAIIKSSNLTKDDKYKLCNYVLTRGVPVNSYNKLNITPLHIASKMQYEKIIKLLLEKGANPSSLDNQNMNSLHYAVQSRVKICEDKKPRNIIKKNKSENKTLKELFNFLVGYMHKEEVQQIYITHIKNTLNSQNLYAMYYPEINALKENFEKNLLMISMNNDIDNENKKKQIFDEKINTAKKIEDLIINSSNLNVLNDLTIKPNTVPGWGPDKTNTQRNILPYKDIQTMKDQTINKYIDSFNNIINEYINDIELLNNDVIKLIQNNDSSYQSLNYIYYLIENYNYNIDYYYIYVLNKKYLVTKYGYLFVDKRTIQIIHTDINNIININENDFEYCDIEQIKKLKISHNYIMNFINKIPIIYRGTRDEYDEWTKSSIRVNKYKLTLFENSQQYTQYIGPNIKYINKEKIQYPYKLENKKPFLDKLNTKLIKIKTYMNNIVQSSNLLVKQYQENFLVYIYDQHIKYQIVKLINIAICLKTL